MLYDFWGWGLAAWPLLKRILPAGRPPPLPSLPSPISRSVFLLAPYEPFDTHPLEVAYVLSDYKLNTGVMVTACIT